MTTTRTVRRCVRMECSTQTRSTWMTRCSSSTGVSEVHATSRSFVKSSREVWQLYQTAKSFGVRPSELVSAPDPYAAYCLDTAVGEFGRALENALRNVEGKNKKEIEVKAERIVRKWLDMPQKFRDPVKSGHAVLPNKDG